MHARDPFGFQEDPLLRSWREQDKQMKQLLGFAVPGGGLHALQAAHRQLNAIRALDAAAGSLKVVREALQMHETQRRLLDPLSLQGLVTANRKVAQALGVRDNDLAQQQRQLADLIGGSASDVAEAFRQSQAMLAATKPLVDQYAQLATGLLPQLSAIRSLAEQMRLFDPPVLPAGFDPASLSAAFVVADRAAEAERIAAAMDAADTPEESQRQFGALLVAMLGIFEQFGENTAREFREMGLFGLLGFLSVVLSFVQLIPHEQTMPSDERAALDQLNGRITHLQAQVDQFRALAPANDAASVASLPRAALNRAAPLRHDPSRSGAILLKAPKGMLLAIQERNHRWLRIIYRDPLTEQPARAWVTNSAVTSLENKTDAPTDPD